MLAMAGGVAVAARNKATHPSQEPATDERGELDRLRAEVAALRAGAHR
jgi:hypothetical protein